MALGIPCAAHSLPSCSQTAKPLELCLSIANFMATLRDIQVPVLWLAHFCDL